MAKINSTKLERNGRRAVQTDSTSSVEQESIKKPKYANVVKPGVKKETPKQTEGPMKRETDTGTGKRLNRSEGHPGYGRKWNKHYGTYKDRKMNEATDARLYREEVAEESRREFSGKGRKGGAGNTVGAKTLDRAKPKKRTSDTVADESARAFRRYQGRINQSKGEVLVDPYENQYGNEGPADANRYRKEKGKK